MIKTYHTLYDMRGNALGTVYVGKKRLDIAMEEALNWSYERRRYRYTYRFVVNKGTDKEFLDIIMKEVR